MTEMTFNGARVFSDLDRRECEEIAEGSAHALDIYQDCLEWRWETAVQNAHDDWWTAVSPEEHDMMLIENPPMAVWTAPALPKAA
jgi:hypothetical protein